ncbi:MAG: hypothetical protein QFX38_01390 [Methanothermobacter sp.]|nr:hypothetical protein [Methanothermobacter sp.]
MRIVTTPMCKGILDIIGVREYIVARDPNTENPDLAIVLSETRTRSRALRLKLNTFPQIKESMRIVFETLKRLSYDLEYGSFSEIEFRVCSPWWDNPQPLQERNKKIKIKVYSNFLKDIVEHMGYTIVKDSPDYIVYPDYMKIEEEGEKVEVPSHYNLPLDPIKRALLRYKILENRICMKH